MTLKATQLWMVGAITGQDADAPPADVERFVKPGPRMSASDAFDVYRLGYHARLVECLLDDYPVLAELLGEDDWEALCRAYVDRHPSTGPNLNPFGRHMAAFCKEKGLDFASELAALEWALVEVLHAECPPPLDASALAAIPPDQWANAHFVTSGALRLLRFEHPVNRVYAASKMNGEAATVPERAPTALAVYRKEHLLWRMELSPAMLAVLEPLTKGQTLGEALGAIEETITDPAALEDLGKNLMVWFREWVTAGFFTRIDL